jgi:AcrR family transcriptional regulator
MPGSALPPRQKSRDRYLDAVLAIVAQDGHEALTVRRLAEYTGLSFPTLYHHFTDLKDLMFAARQKQVQLLFSELQPQHAAPKDKLRGRPGLKEQLRAYVSYFLEHPHLFRFLFTVPFQRPAQASSDQPPADELPDFTQVWQQAFQDLVVEGTVAADDVGRLALTLIYCMHGLILLVLAGADGLTQEQALLELDATVDHLLGKDKEQIHANE